METINKDELENVIKSTFIELDYISREKGNSRLIFPKYHGKGKTRISEQELRFLFIEKLKPFLEKYDCYYSIETPTNDYYKFSENKQSRKPKRNPEKVKGYESAAFDLVSHKNKKDQNDERVAIIEFKSKGNKHEYAKDICKLGNKNEGNSNKNEGNISTLRYFIIVVNNIGYSNKEKKDTKQSLQEKFSIANDQIDFDNFQNDAEINVVCYSLEEGKEKGMFVDIVTNISTDLHLLAPIQ